MNSIQRVLATLTFGSTKHGQPDRVPVFPVPLMQGALVHRCSVEDYFAMPAEKIAAAQIELNRLLDGIPDAVAGFPNVIEDVTAFGVGLKHHFVNSTPAITGLRIRDFAEIATLRVPTPQKSPMLAKTLGIIRELRQRIGEEKIVLGACIAPFSLPSMLMGTSTWMRLLCTPSLRQQYLRPLLDVCEEFVINWAKEQLRAGAHAVALADGMASATLLSRPLFQTYALPTIKRVIGQIEGFVAYEAVGRVEPFVGDLAEVGAIALLLGEEDDIARCKKAAGTKVGLIGNVNNMKLRRWSPARTALRAKQALTTGKPGFGFILGNQGPELPFDVSLDNIRALVNTVDRHGWYELSPTAAAV
jgi:uroporphyrinogen-III decarboxylase